MATAKNILKDWFRNKKKPTQEQFWAWIDSYWHKDEKISVGTISGLEELLNGAATVAQLQVVQQQVILLQQLLKSDDVSLDELQEIVNYIKQNKQVLETLAISNIAGLQDALNAINIKLQALNRGMQDGTVIALAANVDKAYVLPSNSLLFALQLQGAATLQVGSTQSSIGDLGEISSVGNSGILQFGLLAVDEIWLQSDADVQVIPIIYKR